MTPFLQNEAIPDPYKIIFNETLCGSRSIVENVNGILKIRFPILSNGLKFQSYQKAAKTVQVSFTFVIYVKPEFKFPAKF